MNEWMSGYYALSMLGGNGYFDMPFAKYVGQVSVWIEYPLYVTPFINNHL